MPREGFELDLIRSARAKGKSLAARAARRCAAAARARSTRGGSCRAARPDRGDRRRRLQLGAGGAAGGAARHADAAARAERGARADQPAAGARSCSAAAVTFESTLAFFGGKAFVSGNPVRPEFFGRRPDAAESSAAWRPARVLIFGGSQGAHAINMAMVEAAPRAGGRRPASSRSRTRRESAMWRWSATGYRRGGARGRGRAVPLRHGPRDRGRRTWSSAAPARRRWPS